MPFFGLKKIFVKIKGKKASLQVFSPQLCINDFCRKRVLLSASFRTSQGLPGSMTVEAAMGLSIFLFMSVLLIIPMKIMNTERRMQAALEAAGENIAQYAYMKTMGEQEIEKIAENGGFDGSMAGWGEAAGYLEKGALKLYGAEKVKKMTDTGNIRNISLNKSAVLEDGYTIDLIAEYEVCFPFPVFRIDSLKRSVRCCRRAWVGKKGGKGKNGEESNTEKIVYVGKGSIRYHKSRTCHYLFNDIYQVAFSCIDSMRNKEGKRYRSCSICGKKTTGEAVYIMDGGECYHSTPDCRAITAYVQAVPLKSVEHMGPCSYCSGGSK